MTQPLGYEDRRSALRSPLMFGELTVVRTLRDLPQPVAGVITLPADTSWQLANPIDLEGARLVCAGVTTIYGQSSETVTLRSTGLASGAIIYTEHTLALRALLILPGAGVRGVHVNAVAGAYDWTGVNLIGPGQGVEVEAADNAVFLGCVWICDEGGINVDGPLASLVVEGSLVSAQAGTYGVQLDANAAINRRLRMEDSVVQTVAGSTGLHLPKARFGGIPESCRLQDLNVSGDGTRLAGITHLDDEALFDGNRGIANSTRVGLIYWANNATVTTIATAGEYVKAVGTSVASPYNQRFAHPDNGELQYTSALVQTFEVEGRASISAGNNQAVGVAVFKNGVEIDPIRGKSTTTANNKAEGVTVSTIVELEQDDVLELYVTCGATGDITVTDATLLARVI